MILIQNNYVALIERHRAGLHYYVFPGGQVEPGETPETTVRREALEELGLEVSVGPQAAVITFQEKPQYYYIVEQTGGIFGQANGPEMLGLYPPESGTYQAVWLPLADIDSFDVRPAPLKAVLSQLHADWPPSAPLILSEDE